VQTYLEALTQHRGRMAVMAAALALLGAGAMVWYSHATLARERLTLLRLDAQRHAIKTEALTLDGKLMGAVSVLGRLAPEVRQAARGEPVSPAASAELDNLLASVARVHSTDGIDGLFVIDASGLITAGWYASGETSVGLKVGFRPYFKTAMTGRDNVYAAVSLANKGRALYFAAPVDPDAAQAGKGVGVIVARTNLERMDAMLGTVGAGRHALLLSPQGVVFSSSRLDWLGMVAGELTPELIQQIRTVRQFGALFDTQSPRALPFQLVDGQGQALGRPYAMAQMPVEWNDPVGKWRLVIMEDLRQSAPLSASAVPAALGALVVWLLAMSVMQVMRSSLARRHANQALERVAREQAARAERTMQLAQCGLRMQQASGVAELVATFLRDAHRLFGALQGTVYLHEQGVGAACLQLAGSYAGGAAPAQRLALGEGLLGQCALEQKPRLIAPVPGDSPWQIASALGTTKASVLLLAPVLLQGRLLGAVELALLAKPDPQQHEQFLAAVDLFALNLEIKRLAADAGAYAG